MGYLHKTIVAEHLQAFKVMHLEGSTSFLSASFEDICAAYNGIGPDRLPWWARGIVTLCARIFAPAALEHDFAYEQIIALFAKPPFNISNIYDVTVLNGFMNDANERFCRNCTTIVRYRYGILDLRRLLLLAVAKLFFILCERYGLRGLLDGIRTRKRLHAEAEKMTAEVFGGVN